MVRRFDGSTVRDFEGSSIEGIREFVASMVHDFDGS